MILREGGQPAAIQPGLSRLLCSCDRTARVASSVLRRNANGAIAQGPLVRGMGLVFGLGRPGVEAGASSSRRCSALQPRRQSVLLTSCLARPCVTLSRNGDRRARKPHARAAQIAPSRGGLLSLARRRFHCAPGTTIDPSDFQTLTVLEILRRITGDVVVGFPRQFRRALATETASANSTAPRTQAAPASVSFTRRVRRVVVATRAAVVRGSRVGGRFVMTVLRASAYDPAIAFVRPTVLNG